VGFPALCVNWGPLTGGGMLPEQDEAELRRIGVATTAMREATDALAELLGSDIAQAAVVHIDWALFQRVYESRGPCRLFDQVATRTRKDTRPIPLQPAGILLRLRAAPESERREILVAHVQATLGQVLGLEASRLPDCQQGFFDMGMDSLTAMEFRTKLQTSLAVSLPATLAFDYATVDTLADHLLREKLDLWAPATAPLDTRETHDRGAARRELIEQLSDQEVEILLQEKLEAL
jgi:acyl carrier protein